MFGYIHVWGICYSKNSTSTLDTIFVDRNELNFPIKLYFNTVVQALTYVLLKTIYDPNIIILQHCVLVIILSKIYGILCINTKRILQI